MPATSYSKRSRQPAANAGRANDPAAQPDPPILAVVDIEVGDGFELPIITTDRPYTIDPGPPGEELTVLVEKVVNGVVDTAEAIIEPLTPTTFRLTVDMASPDTGDGFVFSGLMMKNNSKMSDFGVERTAVIRGLDNGQLQDIQVFKF